MEVFEIAMNTLLYIEYLIDSICSQYSTIHWGALFVFLGAYILLFRGRIANGSGYVILEKKRNTKQENAYINEMVDMAFSKPNKRIIKRFANWLFCKCYSDEQRGKYFKIFVFGNYVYLSVTLICIVFGFVSLIVIPMRWWYSLSLLLFFFLNGVILIIWQAIAIKIRISTIRRRH